MRGLTFVENNIFDEISGLLAKKSKIFLLFFTRSDNFSFMRTEKLDYKLPAELIAQNPCENRGGSRLLVLRRFGGQIEDRQFSDLGDYLTKGDCLVINDTRVLPGRFYAKRLSGGNIEGLFLEQDDAGVWRVMIKGLGKLKQGERIVLLDRAKRQYCFAKVLEKLQAGHCRLAIQSDDSTETILGKTGFTPLPPYIRRAGDIDIDEMDKQRYQTVYAACDGAVAAPTAGLHFTKELMNQIRKQGVNFAHVTLHVGAGTFKPVKAEQLEDHEIHSERYSIDAQNAEIINAARAKGGRIIAVGTTTVRALESVAEGGRVNAKAGQTHLFIKPGFKFQAVDAMITNFHLPRSTLLALVSAFAGLENILRAYEHAIDQRYRFYSYGDAMLII